MPLSPPGGGSFLGELSAEGKLTWSVPLPGWPQAKGIAVDPAGRIALAGSQQTGTWKRDGAVALMPANRTGMATRLFSGAVADGSNNVGAAAVAFDAQGGLVVAGAFAGTVDFGAGPRTAVGLRDAFVVGLAADLGTRWCATWGGAGDDVAYGLAIDGGRVLVSGVFVEAMQFGAQAVTSHGGADGFVVTLDAWTGAPLDAVAIGGPLGDTVTGVSVASDRRLAVAGNFDGGGLEQLYVGWMSPALALDPPQRFGVGHLTFLARVVADRGNAVAGGLLNGDVLVGGQLLPSAGRFDAVVIKWTAP